MTSMTQMFFTVLICNIARSLNGQCIRRPFTTPDPLGLKLKLLPHAPYSLDLAPLYYFLSTNLKKCHGGQKFSNNEEHENEEQFT